MRIAYILLLAFAVVAALLGIYVVGAMQVRWPAPHESWFEFQLRYAENLELAEADQHLERCLKDRDAVPLLIEQLKKSREIWVRGRPSLITLLKRRGRPAHDALILEIVRHRRPTSAEADAQRAYLIFAVVLGFNDWRYVSDWAETVDRLPAGDERSALIRDMNFVMSERFGDSAAFAWDSPGAGLNENFKAWARKVSAGG